MNIFICLPYSLSVPTGSGLWIMSPVSPEVPAPLDASKDHRFHSETEQLQSFSVHRGGNLHALQGPSRSSDWIFVLSALEWWPGLITDQL